MLMMLSLVLMICSTATAEKNNEPLAGLQDVPAGYFISEDVAQEIFEQYPELEKIFKNEMEVGSGSYMNDETTTELGNKINEIKAEKEKFREKHEVTYDSLQEEREKVEEMKQADNRVIELQEAQIESWKDRYEQQQSQNAIEKAGFAVIIALLAVSD